jgi:hypothetical protein
VHHSRPAGKTDADTTDQLPFCAYPTAAEVDQHGIQPLPETLPVIDLTCGDAYRNQQRRITPTCPTRSWSS